MSEYSKLDLFRREVDTQVAILKQILPLMRTEPTATELDQAVRSTHSLWGTASLIELEIAANLAQAMKDCFAAAESKTVTLGDEQLMCCSMPVTCSLT